jgi:ABC-type Fe3+ transport system permease subunit
MPVRAIFRNWISCILLGLLAFGPIAALCAAAVLDRGPGGEPRSSIFSVAITALDPFVWTCVRYSVAAAGAVAVGSVIVGVFVGRLVGDWRFPARPILIAAMHASAVTPPAIIALGLTALFGDGPGKPFAWLDRLGPIGRVVPAEWGWYAWFWSAIVQGGSITALACLSAQRRLDPAWRDAARLAGGTRSRVWRKLNWPLLRPALAQAAGLVFVLTIADPGAPMILGLRRTLGYQIVVTGLRDDPFPRIAVLGLIALIICAVVRLVLIGWYGPKPSLRSTSTAEDRPLRSGSWRRSATAALFASLWGAIAGAPIAAILVESTRFGPPGATGLRHRLGALIERLFDPAFGALLFDSAWLGLCVCAFFLVSGWLARSASSAKPSQSLLALIHAGISPPLVMGIAALCLPRLAGLAADAIDGSSSHGLALLIHHAASAIASERFGILIPALGVWLAMTPVLLPVWEGGYGTDHAREDRIAAAVLAGSRWAQAHRLASAWSRPDAVRRVALTACLAATNIAPVLLLAHRAEDRTIGPNILLFRENPEFGLGAAATSAVVALAVNVAVVALCSPARLAARIGPIDGRKSA